MDLWKRLYFQGTLILNIKIDETDFTVDYRSDRWGGAILPLHKPFLDRSISAENVKVSPNNRSLLALRFIVYNKLIQSRVTGVSMKSRNFSFRHVNWYLGGGFDRGLLLCVVKLLMFRETNLSCWWIRKENVQNAPRLGPICFQHPKDRMVSRNTGKNYWLMRRNVLQKHL
jgi:hypothetical protein